MTDTPDTTRTFRVHARHADLHHARTLEEPSFEAAAVAYVEHLHVMPDEGDEISVVVREVDTGHEHSFTVSLEGGGATPRG